MPKKRKRCNVLEKQGTDACFKEGDIVAVKLDGGIWWPALLIDNEPLKCSFWDEPIAMKISAINVKSFDEACTQGLLDSSRVKLQSKFPTKLDKFEKDFKKASATTAVDFVAGNVEKDVDQQLMNEEASKPREKENNKKSKTNHKQTNTQDKDLNQTFKIKDTNKKSYVDGQQTISPDKDNKTFTETNKENIKANKDEQQPDSPHKDNATFLETNEGNIEANQDKQQPNSACIDNETFPEINVENIKTNQDEQQPDSLCKDNATFLETNEGNIEANQDKQQPDSACIDNETFPEINVENIKTNQDEQQTDSLCKDNATFLETNEGNIEANQDKQQPDSACKDNATFLETNEGNIEANQDKQQLDSACIDNETFQETNVENIKANQDEQQPDSLCKDNATFLETNEGNIEANQDKQQPDSPCIDNETFQETNVENIKAYQDEQQTDSPGKVTRWIQNNKSELKIRARSSFKDKEFWESSSYEESGDEYEPESETESEELSDYYSDRIIGKKGQKRRKKSAALINSKRSKLDERERSSSISNENKVSSVSCSVDVVDPSEDDQSDDCSIEYPMASYLTKLHGLQRKETSINEDDILRDINNPQIFVKKLQYSDVSKFGKVKKHNTVYNQVHACFFCEKIVTNISKHLKKMHSKEEEVQDIKNTTDQKLKRAKWDQLRNKGDNNHNSKVNEEKSGQLILGRRHHETLDVDDYGPCPCCFQWLKLDRTMYKHQNICPARILKGGVDVDAIMSKNVIFMKSLYIAGRVSTIASRKLIEEVLPIMTKDRISEVAQKDPIIIYLGNVWLARNIGNTLKRKYYASSRMREAARLLLNGRELIGNENMSMTDFLQPSHFDAVAKAALTTASPGFDDEDDLTSPSTAVRLGYDIKRMVNAIWAKAIKENDTKMAKKCKNYIKLYEVEWHTKVKKLAMVTLQIRSFNKEKSLPEPSDVMKIQTYVKTELQNLDLLDKSYASYRKAVQLVQTRLLIFNKRRSGELEGMRLKEFLNRQKGVSNLERSMRSNLSDLEVKLLETQELVEIRGKTGRGVPVIITRDCQKALMYIAQADVRSSAGIKQSNKFMFANTSVGVIRAYDSMKIVCQKLKLSKPEKITSVNLRKYTATIAQVFDLSSQEQQQLSTHLGHTMDIHKIHYRQMSGLIEKIDISKIMLIQEYNLMAKYAGKKLNDITLEELAGGNENENINTTAVERSNPEIAAKMLDQDLDEDTPPDIYDWIEEPEVEKPAVEETRKKRTNSAATRVKWNQKETEELLELFQENIETGVTPGVTQCKRAIDSSRFLQGRSWETIKKKVWNIIQKRK